MIIRQEFAGDAFGVNGRFRNVVQWPAGADRWCGKIANQQFVASRLYEGGRLVVVVRFDDNCKNGHETLSLTATQYDKRGRDIAGGCMHDAIAEVFPEFQPLLPFHLCSTDGPTHYLANTLYLAGNRDYNGLVAGQLQYLNELPARNPEHSDSLNKTVLHGNGIPAKYDWQEKYRRPGFGLAHNDDAPRLWLPVEMIDPKCDLEQFEMAQLHPIHRVGEGKERELDAARRAAIWPEATDDELSASRHVLKSLLEARLPALLETFRRLVTEFGFLYSAE